MALVERHLATPGAWICAPQTPWLFPKRRSAGPMEPNDLFFEAAEPHYIHARGIEAGRNYAGVVAEVLKGAEP